MTTVRIERSNDPTYLCSQQGPRPVNYLYPDETVITVHVSEMDAEVAAALSAEATRICERLTAHSRGGVDLVAAYEMASILLPLEDLPDGKLAHIEITDFGLVVMLPATRISPELAAHISSLGDSVSTIYYIR